MRAPDLPAGFTAEVQDLKEKVKAAGGEGGGTLIVVSSPEKRAQGRMVAVTIMQEDRFLPDKDYKMTALKAYINGANETWTSRGYRVQSQELPDLRLFDPDKRTTARFTFRHDDHQLEVEYLIYFTDRGMQISVVADHADDFQLLSKWADSIRPK